MKPIWHLLVLESDDRLHLARRNSHHEDQLLVGVLPFWNQFRQWSSAQALMRGANAAVVGILGAALYQPVWTSAILGPYEFVLALTGFLLLTVWKLPAWVVVIVVALGGVVITL